MSGTSKEQPTCLHQQHQVSHQQIIEQKQQQRLEMTTIWRIEQQRKRRTRTKTRGYILTGRSNQIRAEALLTIKMNRLASSATLLLICISCLSVEGLRVSIRVPEIVKLGDQFWLNCSASLGQTESSGISFDTSSTSSDQQHKQQQQQKQLYSIKWYKDQDEFYRYLPMENPANSSYEAAGVRIDPNKSHQGNVYLTKADVNTEGEYRCEVTGGAPHFETVKKAKRVKIYALPMRGPRIEILDSAGLVKNPTSQDISYAIGDSIDLRCSTAPSKPAAQIKWFVNEQEIYIPSSTSNNNGNPSSQQPNELIPNLRVDQGTNKQQMVATNNEFVTVSPMKYIDRFRGIYSTTSSLSLKLQQNNLINNRISFKCLAVMKQEISLDSKQLIIMMTSSSSSGGATKQTNSIGNSAFEAGSSSIVESMNGRRRNQRQSQKENSDAISRLLNNNGASSVNDDDDEDSSSGTSSTIDGDSNTTNRRYHNNNNNNNNNNKNNNNNNHHPQQQTNNRIDYQQNFAQQQQQQPHLLYYYENSDSQTGSSILESREAFESFLIELEREQGITKLAQTRNKNVETGSGLIEDPVAVWSDNNHVESSSLGQSGKRGRAGPNSTRSPIYVSEYDLDRPIISWPPLLAGKLILSPSTLSVLAMPSVLGPANGQQLFNNNNNHHTGGSHRHQQHQASQRFRTRQRFPTSSTGIVNDLDAAASVVAGNTNNNNEGANDHLSYDNQQLIALEQVIKSMNCSCLDSSIDTQMTWFINDERLDIRDTRHYPTRVTQDQKQTVITIGLQLPKSSITTQAHNQRHQLYETPSDGSPISSSLVYTNSGKLINRSSNSFSHRTGALDPYSSSLTASSTSSSSLLTTAGRQQQQIQPTMPLSSILAHYYNRQKQPPSIPSPLLSSASSSTMSKMNALERSHYLTNQQGQANSASTTSENIRFRCQARHSMPLYTSTEMITFDFNPPSPTNLKQHQQQQQQQQHQQQQQYQHQSNGPNNIILATSAPSERNAASTVLPLAKWRALRTVGDAASLYYLVRQHIIVVSLAVAQFVYYKSTIRILSI